MAGAGVDTWLAPPNSELPALMGEDLMGAGVTECGTVERLESELPMLKGVGLTGTGVTGRWTMGLARRVPVEVVDGAVVVPGSAAATWVAYSDSMSFCGWGSLAASTGAPAGGTK
jgi:hypothetical protein